MRKKSQKNQKWSMENVRKLYDSTIKWLGLEDELKILRSVCSYPFYMLALR